MENVEQSSNIKYLLFKLIFFVVVFNESETRGISLTYKYLLTALHRKVGGNV